MIELTPEGFLPPGIVLPPARVLVLGPNRSGKTTLVSAFLRKSASSLLYMATDPEAERLRGFAAKYKPPPDRVLVPPVSPNDKGYYEWLVKVSRADWAKEGVDTIVWDTVSHSAECLLNQCTSQEVFSEKHVSFGSGEFRTAMPQEGDYGTAQNALRNITATLLAYQRQCSIVVIAHEEIRDYPNKETGMGESIGGVKLVGKALARDFGKSFSIVIRTVSHFDKESQTPHYYAWIANHSVFTGIGVRRDPDLPIAVLQAKNDVTDAPGKFWLDLRRHIGDTP